VEDRFPPADIVAEAALDALILIDMRLLPRIQVDRIALAGFLAAVRNAAAADGGHVIAGDGAPVARDIQGFDDVRVLAVAAHRELDALAKYRPLFIDAAAHGGLFTRNDGFGNIQQGFLQCVVKGSFCYLAKGTVFQILYLTVKFSVQCFSVVPSVLRFV